MGGASMELEKPTFLEAKELLIEKLKSIYEVECGMVITMAGMYSYYNPEDGGYRWIVYVRYEA